MSHFEELAGDWPAISAMLDELLELPASQRAAWLRALPSDRARLKDQLERLLSARDGCETDRFLTQLPYLPQTGQTPPWEPATAGSRVGPYRLISELGQGGMGTVWLAERADGQLKRQVALKLPRLAWDDSLAMRLTRERDILASLTHPNIARLYDAGTDDQERPYMAMEHVVGASIDAHCAAQGASVRQRLELLLQVCGAVAHAHAHLVIHRDLKPNNILVTSQGQVRLVDFGIAKLMEADRAGETALTHLSGRRLSLDYASPEQIRGDTMGTGSDVYSMGVVAYELLVGDRPYRLKRGSAAELEEAILHADVARASDVAPTRELRVRLRGDLDAILGKALKKSPGDRYPTMMALAEDIERHLDGRPVLARPDSRMYLMRRFFGRHRVAVSALAAILVALGAGLTTALWQTRVARLSQQVAESALAREAAVKMLTMDTLSLVASGGPQHPQTPASAAQTMRSKLDEYEKRFKMQPELRLGLLEAVGSQLPYFGDYAGSLDVMQRYLALLKETKADSGHLLRAHLGIARALDNLHRLPEAAVVLQQSLDTLPESADSIESRVAVMTELGRELARLDRREEAKRWLIAAVQRVGEIRDTGIRRGARTSLAAFYLGFNDPLAMQLMQAAYEEYVAGGAVRSFERAQNLLFLGRALMNVGRPVEAEQAFVDTRELYGKFFGDVDRDTVIAVGYLAMAISAQGRYAEAADVLAHQRSLTNRLPAPDTGIAQATLAMFQLDAALAQGDLTAASRFAAMDSAAAFPRDIVLHRLASARLLIVSGNPDEAVRRLRGMLDARTPSQRWTLDTFGAGLALAEAQLALGDPAKALVGLNELSVAMQAQQAQRSASFQQLRLLSALARSRLGEHVQALTLLAEHDREGSELLPASLAGRADAAGIRAEVMYRAGHQREAMAALSEMRAAIIGQHADSPRLKSLRRLCALLGANP